MAAAAVLRATGETPSLQSVSPGAAVGWCIGLAEVTEEEELPYVPVILHSFTVWRYVTFFFLFRHAGSDRQLLQTDAAARDRRQRSDKGSRHHSIASEPVVLRRGTVVLALLVLLLASPGQEEEEVAAGHLKTQVDSIIHMGPFFQINRV
jgi:hypothetical protein